jgi:phage terminase large subunit-like protein
MTQTVGQSFAEQVAALAAEVDDGPRLVAELLASLSDVEAAALADDWENVWRRPKQTPPSTSWSTWGALTGRGFGKSLCNARYVHREAESGRAMRIGLIAQNEDKCLEVMVNGESGLIAVSPPWFKARLETGRVVWPNGAQGFIYTPEVPGDIFGPEHHLVWASEIHAWPRTKMLEAFANIRMGLRLGYGRLVWDSNPSRRHPILRELLDEAEADRERCVVVRGSSHENRLNLTPGIVDQWEKKYAGTQRGREMIYGEQNDEDDEALWDQEWITTNRRPLAERLKRRVLVVDPSISMRAGTDDSGICDAGLGLDDQVYVIADLSQKIQWDDWGELIVRRYFEKRCDCIVLERNRGGDACVGNVRAAAAKIARATGTEIRVLVVPQDAPTRHVPGIIYVKEVIGRASKGTRAEPVATHYEAGRVSHVVGADLGKLEDLLTTWIPDSGGESPNALDAVVYAVIELAGLHRAAQERRTRLRERVGERLVDDVAGVLRSFDRGEESGHALAEVLAHARLVGSGNTHSRGAPACRRRS